MSNLSNDVQSLSVNRRGPAMEFDEPAAPGSGNPMVFVNDRLRGRWKWVVLVALVLSGGLAAMGYMFAPVTYKSRGIVHVEPAPDTLMGGGDISELSPMNKAEQ